MMAHCKECCIHCFHSHSVKVSLTQSTLKPCSHVCTLLFHCPSYPITIAKENLTYYSWPLLQKPLDLFHHATNGNLLYAIHICNSSYLPNYTSIFYLPIYLGTHMSSYIYTWRKTGHLEELLHITRN